MTAKRTGSGGTAGESEADTGGVEVVLRGAREKQASVAVIAEAMEDQERRAQHRSYNLVGNAKYLAIYVKTHKGRVEGQWDIGNSNARPNTLDRPGGGQKTRLHGKSRYDNREPERP